MKKNKIFSKLICVISIVFLFSGLFSTSLVFANYNNIDSLVGNTNIEDNSNNSDYNEVIKENNMEKNNETTEAALDDKANLKSEKSKSDKKLSTKEDNDRGVKAGVDIDNEGDFRVALADITLSTISLKEGATIPISEEFLEIPGRNLVIEGNNATLTLADGYNGRHMDSTEMYVSSPIVTEIKNLNFKGHNGDDLKTSFDSLEPGGGIEYKLYGMSESMTLKINNSSFIGCYAPLVNHSNYRTVSDGGAIFCYETTSILNNVDFIGNAAGKTTDSTNSSLGNGGGAYYNNSGALVMNGGKFENNSSYAAGGAINITGQLSSPGLSIENVDFKNNYCENDGGAIVTGESRCDFSLKECTFEDNVAKQGNGGAVKRLVNLRSLNSEETYKSCDFINNISGEDGGALFNTEGSNNRLKTLTLDECNFLGNEANGLAPYYGLGGALHSAAISNNIIETTFDGNKASKGGALFFKLSATPNEKNDIDIYNSKVNNNVSTGNGGGICIENRVYQLNLKKTEIKGNSAKGNGGGVFVSLIRNDKMLEGLTADEDTVFVDNYVPTAYSMIDQDDINLHSQQIKSKQDTFSCGFNNAYNNLDIAYNRGNPLNIVSVSYDLNGGTIGGNAVISSKQAIEGSFTENPGIPELKYKDFDGWIAYNTSDSEISDQQSGDRWDFAKDKVGDHGIKLVAQWKDAEYKISFDLNGGTISIPIEDKIIKGGDKVPSVSDPDKSGYIFDGWYKQKYEADRQIASEKWNFENDEVEGDMVLYAGWKKKDSDNGTGNENNNGPDDDSNNKDTGDGKNDGKGKTSKDEKERTNSTSSGTADEMLLGCMIILILIVALSLTIIIKKRFRSN